MLMTVFLGSGPLERPGKTNEGRPRPPIKFSRKTLESPSKHGEQKVGQRPSVEKDALGTGQNRPATERSGPSSARPICLPCRRPAFGPVHHVAPRRVIYARLRSRGVVVLDDDKWRHRGYGVFKIWRALFTARAFCSSPAFVF